MTHDPLAAMAYADGDRLGALLDSCVPTIPAYPGVARRPSRAGGSPLLENPNDLADPEPPVDKAEELPPQVGYRSRTVMAAGRTGLVCGDYSRPRDYSRLWTPAKVFACCWCDPSWGVDLAWQE